MSAQTYWNTIGSKKVFEDPFYLDKLSPFLSQTSQIVEYGCGYGRVLRILKSKGYHHLLGFDFAPNMILRGKKENPDLDLRVLEESEEIPCRDESVDAVVLSTVLCCIVEPKKLMGEVFRVLKKGGVVYIADFLLSEHPRYEEKYAQGMRQFGKLGIYTTHDQLTVRHYAVQEIFDLLREFEIQWFEPFDFKTMNQNPARTFHCIAKKPDLGLVR